MLTLSIPTGTLVEAMSSPKGTSSRKSVDNRARADRTRDLTSRVAGKDATEAFFAMHRSEVLNKYGRLMIGTIENEEPQYILPTKGTLSPVPYAEPGWLTEGFKSPYYNESHRKLQKALRDFSDEYVTPEAREHELSGERVSFLRFSSRVSSDSLCPIAAYG